ncbi:glycosyltransferase family 2 protein [Rhizobium leguminosarum]|uniref:glycosyltransferase family 2 protein n=1 Tax=Rhizobium leguminosarum TaxID=384 RepID=UPI001C92829D|nr:glycosyltransferase family 2 protein [Rhizobium leguminosarum]MBY2962035.1 glycosyltransferase family 2 protein [Rhizobium leguminosarum]
MTLVTFIIPVRHQDNARDWQLLKTNLEQTMISISNQTNPDWRGIVVANEGADLPELPEKFSVERVTFPPNDMHELGKGSKEGFLDAFRADKGRRVLMGMLRARDSEFFMIADDDDLVSAHIVQYVSENRQANGWMIDRGFIWDSGGKLLFAYNDFSHLCGTSLIVRSDLYKIPESFGDAPLEWIKTMLGSHVRIAVILAERGAPLSTLPFRGAVYRVAHGGSHSQAPSLVFKYFLNRETLKNPKRLLTNLSRLRIVDGNTRREFFGQRPSPAPIRVASR